MVDPVHQVHITGQKNLRTQCFANCIDFFFSIFRTALIAQIFVVCLQNRVGILFYSFTCISKINLRGLFITRQLMQQEYQGIIQIMCNHTDFNLDFFICTYSLRFNEKSTRLRPIHSIKFFTFMQIGSV